MIVSPAVACVVPKHSFEALALASQDLSVRPKTKHAGLSLGYGLGSERCGLMVKVVTVRVVKVVTMKVRGGEVG